MLIKDLQNTGLSEKEAKVYLASLELGQSNINQLAKKSEVKRTTIYDLLASLKEKGLISETKKGKKTLYFAEDPRALLNRLEEKKTVLSKIMPQLLSVTNLLSQKPSIRFFEGIEGIKEVYKDTLNYPNQEILAWASEDATKHFEVDWLWNYYVLKRVENRIWERTIAPNVKYMEKLKTYDPKHLRKIKLINPEKFLIDAEINLYGKRNIGIMAFKEKIGLIIESPTIFTTLKSIFEICWGENENN